jgi:ABC-type transport system involved in multi-copper enzyme maturation permease subunit
MRTALIIASLTVREAVRRRLVAALVVITLGMVALSAWGFDRLSHSRSLTSGETALAVPEAFILFMFMFSFVVALSASAIASPSVSGEIDSGVLQAVIARPVRRGEVLAEGAMLLTLVLLLSTRLSALAAGVIGVALFGAAWLMGVAGTLGVAFRVHSLHTAAVISQYLLPTDGLWHGTIYYLEPSSFITRQIGEGAAAQGPFFTSGPPSWQYLTWAVIWLLLVGILGLVSLERREL